MREFTAIHGLPDDVVYKEVVVIGNGPSGISVSHQLSGHWPVLRGCEHPDPMLGARLRAAPSPRPLPLQPLGPLAEGLEGRSQNPLPLLVDCLMHPGADTGSDLPSMLEWKYFPEKQIDHVVLGKGKAGGSWHSLDADVLTLSPARWMALPGVALGLQPGQRAPVPAVAAYYEQYVRQAGLQRFFRNNTLVTSVKPVKLSGKLDDCAGVGCPATAAWCVCGYDSGKKESFRYVCSRVVLATGAWDRPNRLPLDGAPGGAVRTPPRLQAALDAMQARDREPGAPVSPPTALVLGSGLSAADAVLRLRARGVPTVHAHRGPSAALRALPSALYPEYHEVHQMMKDGAPGKHPLYTALPDHTLVEISRDGKPLVEDDEDFDNLLKTKLVKLLNTKTNETVELKVCLCIILIGSRPDLHFLPENFDSNYLTWNLNSESLKSEVLSNVRKEKTFERSLDVQTNGKLLKHPTEMCIKCSYNNNNVTSSNRTKLQSINYGKACFLKTQWSNLKYIVGQGLQKTRSEVPSDKDVEHGDEKEFQHRLQGKNLLNADFTSSVVDKLESLDIEMQGSGLGLGVHPEKSIDSRTNPICIDKISHSVQNAPNGLYALGPLTGDNFVRFIPGGALAIVSHIWNERKAEESSQDCNV